MVLADIKPSAFYDDESVCEILDISSRKLAQERAGQSLRFVTRAGRNFYRGQWLIAWLEGAPVSTHGMERASA